MMSNKFIRMSIVFGSLAILSTTALADFSGNLGSSDLVENWATTGSQLSWTVKQLPDYWFEYTYTLTLPTPAVSHFIVEVSESFGANDYRNLTYGGLSEGMEIEFPPTSGSFYAGSPSMPTDADWNAGFKINAPDDYDGTTLVLRFDSNRVPVWGDFYAKGGSSQYIYNSGLGYADPLVAPHNGPHWTTVQLPTGAYTNVAHLLVPDTITVVPVPGAMLLGSLGLGFAGWLRKRQNV